MNNRATTMAAANTSSTSSGEKKEAYNRLYAFAVGQLEKEKQFNRLRIARMNPTELVNHINQRENKRRRATKPATLYEYHDSIQSSKQPMQHKPWEPKNNIIETDPVDESELTKKMLNTIVELANSDFYSKLVQQIQTPQFLNHFSRVLGSEPMFQVVVYGAFAHFSRDEPAQRKLALMLLLKRDFNDRIGKIEIFDSYFNNRDIRVLEDLGFSVLRVDENSYREALKPTLFYLDAPEVVYDHVLRANWKPENLNRMIILGSTLNDMKIRAVGLNQGRLDVRHFDGHFIRMRRYLMCIHIFTTQIAMSSIDDDKISEDIYNPSWQFFNWCEDDPKMKLRSKRVVVFAGVFYYLYHKYRTCKHIYDKQFYEEETYSWKRNYSNFFRLGWLFRRHRIRNDKRLLLEKKNKKKKKRMLFYLSRTIVVPWFEGLPRKEWARARKIAKEVMNWLKRNEARIFDHQFDEARIFDQQFDELIGAWF